MVTAPAELTDAQVRVMRAIRDARREHPHYGPSYREIQGRTGHASVNPVWVLCHRLESDGLIATDTDAGTGALIVRSIRLTPLGKRLLGRAEWGRE